MAVSVRPDAKTATIEELASWWAENADEIKATDSFMWVAKSRLREAIRDQGPLQTALGKLSLGADKMDWDPAVAVEFPTLGRHIVTVKVGTLAEAEQIIELTLGQVPGAEVNHDLKVEARLASAYLKVATPEQMVRLAELRTANGKLVVMP